MEIIQETICLHVGPVQAKWRQSSLLYACMPYLDMNIYFKVFLLDAWESIWCLVSTAAREFMLFVKFKLFLWSVSHWDIT